MTQESSGGPFVLDIGFEEGFWREMIDILFVKSLHVHFLRLHHLALGGVEDGETVDRIQLTCGPLPRLLLSS